MLKTAERKIEKSDIKLTGQFEKPEVLNLLKLPDSGKPHKLEVENRKLIFSLNNITKKEIGGQRNIQSYMKKIDVKTGNDFNWTRQETIPDAGLEKENRERILSPRKRSSCEVGSLPGVYSLENSVSKVQSTVIE